jgi:hypothetical protein
LTVARVTAQLQAHPTEDLAGVAKQQGVTEAQLYTLGLQALQTASDQMVTAGLWTKPQADEEMQYWRQVDPLVLLNGVTSWFRQDT